MGIARIYQPTCSDTEVVNSIMNEHMTLAYRYQYEFYLHKYKIPKCLRILKLWLWDVKEGRQHPPDAAEDEQTRKHRVQQLLTIAQNYDGVSKFPKLGRKSRRTTDVNIHNMRKRCHQSPPLHRPTHGYSATKSIKIEISNDNDASDDDAGKKGEEAEVLPITPPPAPPPPYGSRPPRLRRPKPVDPRLHHHPQPPSSPPTAQREEAGRCLGLDSYVVENIVRHMSDDDWLEFLTRRKYGRALINELQAYLNEKYCNEEHTEMQLHYGQLCNRAMYPMYYPPYEMDLSAKQYHMRENGELPLYNCTTPRMFFMREFGGSSFPVYMNDDEYDYKVFRPHEMAVEDHSYPSGYYTYTKHPTIPAHRDLCTRDGDDVVFVRNMPVKPVRKEAQRDNDYEVNE